MAKKKNTGKPVVIEILGSQAFQGSPPETIELVTDGFYSGSAGQYKIEYSESEITGLAGTVTTFEVNDGTAVLTREGTVSSQMIFEPGRKHFSLFEMGFGSLTVGVDAHRVRNSLGDNGGTLEIDYAIEIEHLVAGENTFRIHVRESADKTLIQ